MDGVAAARQGKAVGVGEGAPEAGRPRRLPTPSDEKKQNNACPTMPCACPWPLAACPSPEASHNKADLNKVMSLPIRSESGARVRAVGLAVRQRGLGTQKERKNEPQKNTPGPVTFTLPLGPCPTPPPEATHDPASSERLKTTQRKRAAREGGARGGERAAGRWRLAPTSNTPLPTCPTAGTQVPYHSTYIHMTCQ